MNYGFAAEILFSLTLQSTLLLLITRWLAGQQSDCRVRDRLWSSCHLLILCASLTGLLLPHFRIMPEPAWPARWLGMPVSPDGWWVWKVVVWVWLSGVLILFASVTTSLIHAGRLIRRSAPADSLDAELLSRIQLRSLRILVNSEVTRPFCWQFHRPAIIFPRFMLSFPREELTVILLHERAHLIEHHPFQLFLQRMVEMIFWFNPLTWLASRESALQRELVCDRQSVSSHQDKLCLLKGLYRLSTENSDALKLPVGLRFSGESEALRHRVDQLLNGSSDPLTPLTTGATGVAYIRILIAIGMVIALTVWFPFDPAASGRARFSPWPSAVATALKELGIVVRDYEIDAHRHRPHIVYHNEMDHSELLPGPSEKTQTSQHQTAGSTSSSLAVSEQFQSH